MSFQRLSRNEKQLQNTAATRIQAAARRQMCGQQYTAQREIKASVAQWVIEATAGVTTYVIVVHRGGRTWEVQHRYSDWGQLDASLRKHLKQLPALPSRSTLKGVFASASLRAARKQLLSNWLKEAILLSDGVALARLELLNFLSTSHTLWQYADLLRRWPVKADGPVVRPTKSSTAAKPKLSKALTVQKSSTAAKPKLSKALTVQNLEYGNYPCLGVDWQTNSFKEDEDKPVFRISLADMTNVQRNGEEVDSFEQWAPFKTGRENWMYWMRVLGV